MGSIDIARILRREINSGALETGSRLPPGRELAKTYGVARGTLREALKTARERRFGGNSTWKRHLCRLNETSKI